MWAALVGQTIGKRYEIRRHIATGGMAAVFEGWDHRDERPVAIKVLRQLDDATPADVERFRREAQAAAALECPQIVRVYDFVEDPADGCAYLILEYVDGGTLKDRIAAGAPLPPREALRIAAEVCRALQCAHAHGFIHRDIKPQNVLLAASGAVKLTDFGIVHVSGATGFTTSGMVLGTADYISPEQAQGLPLTPATDIYSLGVVLFEMLAGTLPFEGTSVLVVAMQHATKPVPSLRQLNPDVPPRVERLVRRALAKEPERRFRSAREMELALRETAAILEAAELVDPVAAGVISPTGAAQLAAEGDTTLPKPGRIRHIPPVAVASPAAAQPARPRPEPGESSTWDDASLPSAVLAAYQPPTSEHPAARARLAAVAATALLLLAGIFLLAHGL